MGVGKTTAIGQVSDVPPVFTDVANTRRSEEDKATTTAAFDYGEIKLGESEVLRLYGTPGQRRFEFMWPVLARGALGIIYLIDCGREKPLDDLDAFINAFGSAAATLPSVVALNKIPAASEPPTEIFQGYLEQRGINWPVLPTDVREREEVLAVLEILLSIIEAQALDGFA